MKKGKAEEEKPLITPDAPVQKERELQVRVDVHDAKRKSVGAKEFPHHGLSSDEAARRLAKYGPNSVEEKGKPTWRLLLEKFIGPMEILIEIAVILSLMNGIFSPQHDYVSFVVLLVLLLINGFIGFF
jgi:magnesium-transporting ATPase (P-type)